MKDDKNFQAVITLTSSYLEIVTYEIQTDVAGANLMIRKKEYFVVAVQGSLANLPSRLICISHSSFYLGEEKGAVMGTSLGDKVRFFDENGK